MVKGDLWHEIHSRRKLKETKKSIARAVGLSLQTVRKILRQVSPQPYARKPAEGGLLEPFREYILQRVAAVGYCAQAVFECVLSRENTRKNRPKIPMSPRVFFPSAFAA